MQPDPLSSVVLALGSATLLTVVSPSLGDLVPGLSGIKKAFRNPQVHARFGSTYTIPKSILHPMMDEPPNTPRGPGTPSPQPRSGRARSWERVMV